MVASRAISLRVLTVACILLAASLSVARDDPKQDDKAKEKPAVVITAPRMQGNVFGESDSEFQFQVESRNAIKGRVTWRIANGTATIKAGEVNFNTNANATTPVSFKAAIPPIKDGVILQTQLTLAVIDEKGTKPEATFEQDLWIFPKDPFADRTEWVKKLKLTLYDPKGGTAKIFTAANLPFEEARDVDALAAVKEGLVIIGEGVSFKDERGLSAVLNKLATDGRTVLILAPSAGEVLIPGVGGPAEGWDELTLRREIVRKLDKRLDPDGWLPDGKAVASSVVVKMGEEATVGEVSPGAAGWTWIEVRGQQGKGRWALCGLGIIAKWETGPTPRFLFARMLEYLTDSGTEQPKKENDR